MPGTKTSEKSWMTRSQSANKMADLREPTERARAFHGLQRERPSAAVRACANESLQPRAAGAALLIFRQQRATTRTRHAMRLTCAASLPAAARLAPLTRRRLWMRDARALRTATRSIDDGRSSSTKLSSAAEKRGTAGGRGRVGFLSQLQSSSIGAPPSLSILIQPRLRLRVRYFALEVRRI